MTTQRIGLVLNRPTPSATIDAIVQAEQRGVPAVWSTVGGANPDAVTLFAAAAVRTQRIALGTAIVPAYPRHPIVLASQALVLANLAPDRFRLGVGPSHRPAIEGMFGIPHVKPLAYMREYLTVLRQLLWDGRSEFAGEFFTVHVALREGMTPPRVPLLLSALRANAFRLAGEIADGAISWLCPVPYLVSTALPALQAGAQAAQRSTPPLIAHVPVAMHDDRMAVRAAARPLLSGYGRLPFYARMLADAGYPFQDDGTPTDALIDALIVSGDPAHIVARLAEIQASGMGELLVMLVPVVDAIAEETALIAAITGSV
ncbi:MAG TPA: LLM class flavin-dependent oxidoreductase [Chloroflexota bacterium]|jgi:F420-dependent oxidoreductase-like protein|nr:LLM class flavin-dependent oxidoreductase [Chloroflexota bacterium]